MAAMSLALSPTARRVLASRPVLLGLAIVALMVLAAILAPYLTSFDPTIMKPRFRLKAPDATYWFGTDALGRDLFSRVLHGGQVSLFLGLVVCVVAVGIGTVLGLLAGATRLLDAVLMRIMDGIMAIPSILLAVAMVSLFGASFVSVVIAIAFPDIPRVVRLVRSVVLSVREEPYVEAALGLGVPRWLVLLRHVLPNCVAPLTVQATYIFASAILVEAVLGFLGVGYPPDVPTWGNILAEGRNYFQQAPWTIFFAGGFLAATVLSVNILGDGLRDQLDPKLAGRRS
ncbi:ABC transporter permease [Tistrella mobilis]|uniref:ABC transporter permease n=1 Tax=Tistrella mobilis TaxID=171437 RepID=UPI0035582740